MLRARSVLVERRVVHRRDVALVAEEVVRRPVLVQPRHDPVPGHLGHDRRCRDRRADPVALPHREPRRRQPPDREPVGQHVGRGDVEPGQRPAHALDVADVQPDPVDLAGRDHDDRPRRGPADDLVVHPLPGRGGEQLGVGEAGHLTAPAGGEHDGRDDQRARAGAAPRLVGAGDRREPGPLEGALVGPQAAFPAYDEPLPDLHHASTTTGWAGGPSRSRSSRWRARVLG